MVHLTTETASAPIVQASADKASTPAKAKSRIPAIDVNAILFRAANECVSDEETRYYLNGVYVQPHPEKGVLLTATDGHRLVCIHDETGSCDGAAVIMVKKAAWYGFKINPKKPLEIPRLRLDDYGHVVVGTYRSLESSIIDATYPDYKRILTPFVEQLKKGISVPASFNHEYLVGFSRIASLISSGSRGMRILSTAENDPCLILFAGAPHAFGILMPMRTNIGNGMPAWMRPVLEPSMRKAEPAAPTAKRKSPKNPKAKPAAKKRRR